MRLGLLADVHSNLHALEAVLEDAQEWDIERWVFLGDAVGYNAFPNECVHVLRELEPTAVCGNHDDAVLSGDVSWFRSVARAGVDHSREQLDDAARKWLDSLPPSATIDTGAVHVHAVHGSPRDPLHEYVMPHETDVFYDHLLQHEAVDGAPVLLLGHTHVPLERATSHGRVVNPGSVGQPRDADARAAWAFVDVPGDDGTGSVTFRRVPYDVEAAQQAIRDAGLPEMLASRLGQGV